MVLLVGALLFLMTLRHLRSVELGFDPAGVTVVTLSVRGYGYTDARAVEYLTQVADAVRRQPGIQAAGVAFSPPLFSGGLTDGMYLPDQDPSQATNVERNGVSPVLRGGSPADRPRPRVHRGRGIWPRGNGPQASRRHRSIGATAFGSDRRSDAKS